ncbi:DNA-binding transcriptional regulator GbsR, MarR family [Nonomuraea solani]|uniref:DNA-binding transcriptional regulator GbsR, MarR family n=1 Tax=Nonomuraea solani TaxID=1144553 RepID=A0A1H6E1F3_9ACTN|nr:MarR family transcriptional regulator [Nonomuraea solani]SEG91430.1 DNA-binding transcriptional regulator GbsR, MarR family [Nonomuraea solani]
MSTPPEAELEFVDDVAGFFAREGMPLIAGRVIGWLLISDPPEQSAAELADVLRVSRSSISSATRLLTPSGLVKGVRRRGDRQEYFRIEPDGWSRMLAARYAKTAAFREITEAGLRTLANGTSERRERLAGVNELYRFLEEELPALWERWEARRDGGPRPSHREDRR